MNGRCGDANVSKSALELTGIRLRVSVSQTVVRTLLHSTIKQRLKVEHSGHFYRADRKQTLLGKEWNIGQSDMHHFHNLAVCCFAWVVFDFDLIIALMKNHKVNNTSHLDSYLLGHSTKRNNDKGGANCERCTRQIVRAWNGF